MSAGRPSEYTQEKADALCSELAEGKSLRTVCAAESMPSTRTVFTWMRTYPEFLLQYERAKEEAADALADEIVEIADDGSRDYIEGENGPVYNAEHVQRSRLRVDARKWIASKLKPKKYGEKVQQEHTGANGGAIIMSLTNQDAQI